MTGQGLRLWLPVRRAILDLPWTGRRTPDLLQDWTETLNALLAARRALGDTPVHDPMALLASATSGAHRATRTPIDAPSLHSVREALVELAQHTKNVPAADRARHIEVSHETAYELVHWVRVRHPAAQARRWLLAGESALDVALHAPTTGSATGRALATWQAALADVHALRANPVVQRGVAAGHALLLQVAQQSLKTIADSSGIPETTLGELHQAITQLRRAHRTTEVALGGRPWPNTRANDAIRLRLGEALASLTNPTGTPDPPHMQFDALLRSGFGQAELVAQTTPEPAREEAAMAAAVLQRIGRQHLYNPDVLRLRSPTAAPHPEAPRAPQTPWPDKRPLDAPVSARIAVGADLDQAQIEALCRDRDLGSAAASADPADPPELLAEIPPTQWPHVVIRGREAVADLVASVTPMVYALLRGTRSSNDLRSELLLNLVSAARRFQPDRTESSSWPAYAWGTLSKVRLRGVDEVGGPFRRLVGQPTSMLPFLDALAAPDARLLSPEQGSAIAEIADAIDSLPPVLRRTLLESMQGRNSVTTAERLSVDPSTVRRRLNRARDIVGQRIGYHPDRGTGIRP